MHDIDEITIEEFLEYLENNRKNSISTRNQRLAALHSFYRYLQKKRVILLRPMFPHTVHSKQENSY